MDVEALRKEAIHFGRYLVDAVPSEELIERYRRANAELLAAPPTDEEAAVLAFACAHPWSIPMLDAGTALSGAAPLFRRKLLVMMALVETTPELFDRTAPASPGLARLLLRLGLAGARTAVNLAAGLALSAALTRRRVG